MGKGAEDFGRRHDGKDRTTIPWLRDEQERVDELGGERFELGGALGAGLKLVLFADKPVAIGLDGAGAEASGDEVGRLAVEGECVRPGGSEQGAAVPSSDADVGLVHREGHDLESALLQAVENRELLGGKLHGEK
jgi:hypothetical protein